MPESVHNYIIQYTPQWVFFGISTLFSVPLFYLALRRVRWTYKGRHDKWATGLLISTILFEFLSGVFFIADSGYGIANITHYSSDYRPAIDEGLEIFGILCDLTERSLYAGLLYRIATSFLKARMRYDEDGNGRKIYWFVSRAGALLVLALAMTSTTQFIVEAVFVYNQFHEKGYYDLVMPESELALVFSGLQIFLMIPMFLTFNQIFGEVRRAGNAKTLTLFGLALLCCSLENTFRIASTSLDVEVWKDQYKTFSIGLQTTFTTLVVFTQFTSIVFITVLGCAQPYEEILTVYSGASAGSRPAMSSHDQHSTRPNNYHYLSSAPTTPSDGTQDRNPLELQSEQRPTELGDTCKPNELQSESKAAELGGEILELGDGNAIEALKLKPDPEGFRNNSSMGLDAASQEIYAEKKMRNAFILK